jgi:hypothetical protein
VPKARDLNADLNFKSTASLLHCLGKDKNAYIYAARHVAAWQKGLKVKSVFFIVVIGGFLF